MNLTIDQSGSFPVAKMSGEWRSSDGEDHHETLHALVAEPDARLAIDLSGLKMLDSHALSVLINLGTRARLSRARMVLVAPSPFVAGVFEVTRLDRWFDLCADSTQAARMLQS